MTNIKEFVRDSLDGLSHAIDQAVMEGVTPSDKAVIKYAILDDEYYSSLSKEYIKLQVIQYGKKHGKRVLIGYTSEVFPKSDKLPKSYKKVTLDKLV